MRRIFWVSLCSIFLFSAPAHAARIVVFGDSWGVPAAPALQAVLVAEGLPDTVANAAFGGDTAANLSSAGGLAHITSTLGANLDADLVHLSIGGNDFLGAWNSSLTPMQEATLFQDIADDIETILDHIIATRPGVQILLSSYDYPRPLGSGTPTEVNAASATLTAMLSVVADTKGGSVTAGNYLGLMQVNYGFDGVQHTPFDPAVAIPAGDPSLPDPTLPSPNDSFTDPIHLTSAGYAILAQEQFDTFYGPILQPSELCPATALIGCDEVAQAKLQLSEKKPGKEKLKVQWKGIVDSTDPADFGDPVTGTDAVSLCLYSDTDDLLQEYAVDRAGELCAGKPCWKAKGTTGYQYKDKDASADGIDKLSFSSGAAGKGKADAKGRNNAAKGQSSLPTGLAATMAGGGLPTVQLSTDTGFCVTATMTSVQKNDGLQYKAQKK